MLENILLFGILGLSILLAAFGILWAILYPILVLWAFFFSGKKLDAMIINTAEREAQTFAQLGKDPLSTVDGGYRKEVSAAGVVFAGAVYASIGTFASSLFDNQVVAFIIGVFIVLMFFLFDKLLIFVPSIMASTIQYLSVDYHISNMSRGVIDTRNIIYFISVIGMFLFATVQVLSSRRWK